MFSNLTFTPTELCDYDDFNNAGLAGEYMTGLIFLKGYAILEDNDPSFHSAFTLYFRQKRLEYLESPH
jgi:hypothetical protein